MKNVLKIQLLLLLVIGFMTGVFGNNSFSAVFEVKETQLTSWPHTIYYLAHLSGPGGSYDDITVHITAVDEYILYINGRFIGSDNDWQTVETYTVNISGDDMIVGVKVHNNGIGHGNGLMVDIQAGADCLGTTTLKRRSAIVEGNREIFPVTWYYYDEDMNEFLGEDWYTLQYDPENNTTILDNDIVKSQLKEVVPGDIGNISYLPDRHIEIVTGYPRNVDLGSVDGGGISLRRIDGVNIALGKPSVDEQYTDGKLTRIYHLYLEEPPEDNFIDLERIYRVNKMTIYTAGNNPDKWEMHSLRGFAAEISLDKFRWEEVNIIHEIGITNADNGGYDYASVEFPDEWARYVRFRIIESREYTPRIGEIMIYGTGYVYDGEYESPWIDFGSFDKPKNFDKVYWEGDVPEGTRLKIQTKSGLALPDGSIRESQWSPEYTTQSFNYESPEPASMFKYRVRLSTQDIHRTPVLKSFSVSYSEQLNVTATQPVETELSGNFPNPFNTNTMISFSIGSESCFQNVQIKIFDLNGQLVTTLLDTVLNSGIHQAVWDSRNHRGEKVASGIYICLLIIGDSIYTNKMLLLK